MLPDVVRTAAHAALGENVDVDAALDVVAQYYEAKAGNMSATLRAVSGQVRSYAAATVDAADVIETELDK